MFENVQNLLLENDGKQPIKKNEILDGNDRLVPGGEKKLLEVGMVHTVTEMK